ncbi:hypothetical protein vBVpaS1601_57 [Vibrio phage vB_VpaS_1601]|nr:hypothetical protein vBVpaP1601_57 [Vibrio phage vB_VpaP_1601]
MAKPASINLSTVKRGDTYMVDFFFTDTDGTTDISAVTIDAQARREIDGALWFDLKPKVVDASKGHFRIHLTGDETRAITESPVNSFSGIYDIQFSWQGPSEIYVSTIIDGSISISKDVTQPVSLMNTGSNPGAPTPAADQTVNVYFSLDPGTPNYSDVVTAEELTPVQYQIAASMGLANVNVIDEVGEAVALTKKYRDEAAAIVTGGTATVDPEPGKIPLADEKGKIREGWLPDVAVFSSKSAVTAVQTLAHEQFAASGFINYGKNIVASLFPTINEGLNCRIDAPDMLLMGRVVTSQQGGSSKTAYPVVAVAGFVVKILGVNDRPSITGARVKFPKSPDGTVTYNKSTGESVTHADQSAAFLSADADPSVEVVTNRVDVYGFEFGKREINQSKPFLYLCGCNQSQATSIDGIDTVVGDNNPVFDGDTSVGKGVNLLNADTEQRIRLVNNPDNNVWVEGDTIYQFDVQQITIAGPGNGDWKNINPAKGDFLFDDNRPVLSKAGLPFVKSSEQGVFEDGKGNYFLVCGSVPRLNQGAFHPTYNPEGVSTFMAGGTWSKPYYAHNYINSTASCFKFNPSDSLEDGFIRTVGGKVWVGSIESGSSGHPSNKSYEVIYPSGQGGVVDCRRSAEDMGSREEASKIAIKYVNGSYRGEELYNSTTVSGEFTFTYTTDLSGLVTLPRECLDDTVECIVGSVRTTLQVTDGKVTLPDGAKTVTFTTRANVTKPSKNKPVLNAYDGVLGVFDATKKHTLLDFTIENGIISDYNAGSAPYSANLIYQISNSGQASLGIISDGKYLELSTPYGYTKNKARAGVQIPGVDL